MEPVPRMGPVSSLTSVNAWSFVPGTVHGTQLPKRPDDKEPMIPRVLFSFT